MKRRYAALIGIGIGIAVLSAGAVARNAVQDLVGPHDDGTALLPTGQDLTPAGTQATLAAGGVYADRPFGIAVNPKDPNVAISSSGLSTQSVMLASATTGAVQQVFPYDQEQSVFPGMAYTPDGRTLFVAGGGTNAVRVYRSRGGRLLEQRPIPIGLSGERFFPAGSRSREMRRGCS